MTTLIIGVIILSSICLSFTIFCICVANEVMRVLKDAKYCYVFRFDNIVPATILGFVPMLNLYILYIEANSLLNQFGIDISISKLITKFILSFVKES